jgi:prolyl oligopeptidase
MKWLAMASLLISTIQMNAQLSYPVTKKVQQTDNYFGTNVNDPYRWLEDDKRLSRKNGPSR